MTEGPPERRAMTFASAAAWAEWLEENHALESGIWLRIAKRESGAAGVGYDDALRVALCFGWIDGQKARGGSGYWLQRFTPRSARSRWSKINRARAEELAGAGEMRPAGLREVERARADGRWDAAYDGSRTAAVPADLQAALDAEPAAKAFFATLDRANRYAVLYRVQDAKRPQTRARRIETFVAMLAAGEKLHP
jgi:uncharacterized protein YdeI (YjbR/CyaY-like superfamily)